MNYWLVPINTADFDFNQYLGKYHFVDWVQFDDRIQIDDIAYIYDCKQKRITHKMVVSAVSFDFDQATNDENLWHNRTKMLENISEDVFYRLKPVQTVESKLLGYENLKVHNFPENPIHDLSWMETSGYISHRYWKVRMRLIERKKQRKTHFMREAQ